MSYFRHNTRKHTSRRGFSLLELIITIVVLGLLASIAFVGYDKVVTRAATSSTEASLMHIDRAVSVTHAMRTAAEPGIRIDDDFATAAYGADMDSSEDSEISSSTGTWDLTRATAETTGGFDPSTVYYAISPTGITGMVKTVIGSSPNGDRWHLSFLKSSPVETITWSSWCEINPADLASTVSMNPNFTTWPAEGCHYEGTFQAGENPFPVTEVEGQSITPGEGSVSVTLPSSFEGIADQVRVTVLAHDSAGDSASPVGEPISKVILAPAAGDPKVVEFNSVDEVVPGLWYSASIDYITAGQVDNSYAVTEPASVQPWTLPAVLNPGLAVNNNLGSVSVSTPDVVFDPSITATVAIPTSDSVESGFREITSATLHYREVGADNWSTESVDLATGTATVSFSSADQGKSFEFAVSFVNSGSSESNLSALEVEGLPEASLGSLPAAINLTASHNPVRGDLDSQKVAWSWSGGTGSFVHAFSPDTDTPVSGNSATTTGLGETHTSTVTSCNDWGCSTVSLSQEVGNVPNAPAPPTPPAFHKEDAEPQPDVHFTFTPLAEHAYEIRHKAGSGSWSAWSTVTGSYEAVDVGQYTNVCAQLRARTSNEYGDGAWSLPSSETCHTTEGVPVTPASIGTPVFVKIDAESNPDVWFRTSATNTSTNEYRLRRVGTTETFTGTKEFVDVGQNTNVCVEQQRRTKNAYGWSNWTVFGADVCHKTGSKPTPPSSGTPVFVKEDKEANPDVWFRTSASNTSTDEYRLRRVGTTATYTGTKEFVNVGQNTNVCVEQQHRTKNAYGWSNWSAFGADVCHKTGVAAVGSYPSGLNHTHVAQTNSDLQVRWTPKTGETYEIHIYDTPHGNPKVVNNDHDGYYRLNDVGNCKNIRVYIRSYKSNAYGGGWSGWARQDESIGCAVYPENISGLNHTHVAQTNSDLQVRWTDRPGETYEIHIYDTPHGNPKVVNNDHDGYYRLNDVGNCKNIRVYIRAYKGNAYGGGWTGWARQDEYIGCAATGAYPSGVNHTHVAQTNSDLQVRWTPKSGETYEIHIYDTPHGNPKVVNWDHDGYYRLNDVGNCKSIRVFIRAYKSNAYGGGWSGWHGQSESIGCSPNVSMWRQSSIHGLTGSYHQATLYVDWGTTDHSGGNRAPTYDSWQLLNTSWQVVASGTSSVGGSGQWIGAAPNSQYLARVQSCNSYGCSGWKSDWWTYTQPRTPYKTKDEAFDWIGQCDSVSYATSHGSIGLHNVHVPNWGWGWSFWKDFGHGDHHHVNGLPIFVHNYGRSGKTSICNNWNGSFTARVDVSMGGIYSQSDQGRFYLSR